MADTTVRIENIAELSEITHTCTATDKLTDILVKVGVMGESIMNLAAASQELNARFEEQSREMRQFMQAGHQCRFAEQIAKNTNAIDKLNAEQHKKVGSDYWVEKFVESLKYIILFVIGMFIAFILNGGHLSP
jgi:hypothetical protein